MMRGALLALGEWAVRHPCRAVAACWLVQVGWLLALQAAGAPFGFAVWPMGEDRNWLRFMLDAPGLAMMREFWRMNDRNPLSPWWYWLFSWPVLHVDWALYALRRVVDLLLAVAVVDVVRTLTRERESPWALAAGLLVLSCAFSGFREQIVWNFQVAAAVGLFALAAYARFVDGGERAPRLLGVALLAYLVSIATYTLNVGLLGGLAVVAALRRPATGASRWPRARIGDVALFAAVTLVFLMIWYTTTRPSSSYYQLDAALAARQLATSVSRLLWHPDYTWYIGNGWRQPSVILASLVPFAVFATVIGAAFARPAAAVRLPAGPVAWIMLAFAGLAASVVMLESTSPVWLPGYRSKMFYQVTSPLLAVVTVALAVLLVARFFSRRTAAVVAGGAVILAIAATMPAATYYNKLLVEQTARQKALASALAPLVDEHPGVRAFVIRSAYDPVPVWGADALSDTYARTMLRRSDVSMRFLQRRPPPDPAWKSWWRVVLGADSEGAANTSLAATSAQPYRMVRFVDWDGTRFTVPKIVDAAWFEGFEADWRRDGPIVQKQAEPASCPTVFDFAVPPNGRGWSVPEPHPAGGYAMWMASTHATMRLHTSCTGRAEIRLVVAGYMGKDILDGLVLEVQGRSVPLAPAGGDKGGGILAGRFEVDGTKPLDLELRAPRTEVPAGGNRTLAIMFKRLTVVSSVTN